MGNPNDWNQKVIEEFRANDGKVGGMFEGMPLLLLHTIGAKSQQERINPVACMQDGDRYMVFASKGGAPTNPDWYYNLVAQPLVTVEVGTEKFQARATVAEEPERTQIYSKMAAERPNFAEYEQKTTRKIPVVILTRVQ
jgi:deazaflavin-dependent oxidoreductase (nitroreductase family)